MLGRSPVEAYAVWSERMGEVDTPRTMNQLFDRYLIDVVPMKAKRTQESNEISISKLRPVFGRLSPASIKPKHAYKYNDAVAKKRSTTTARRDIETLRHVLTKAVEWGVIDRNQLLGQVRIEHASSRDRYVEAWEVTELFKVTGHQMRSIHLAQCFVRLKLLLGSRRGDILDLKLTDLKEDGIHIQPSKTRNSTGRRQIYQWSEKRHHVVDKIKAIPPRRIGPAHLFTTRQGKPYSKNAFDSLWQRFRAKVATDSFTLLEAAERLGHSDPSTTNRIYRRKPVVIKPIE